MTALDDANTCLDVQVEQTRDAIQGLQCIGFTYEQAVLAIVGAFTEQAKLQRLQDVAANYAVAMARLAANEVTIRALDADLQMHQALVALHDDLEKL